jgi:nucleotide-binding universal stress UspA family protein
MSFNFGFSRTTIFLAAAACASALSTNPSAAGGSMEVCARYADDAFYAVDDMKRAGCSEVDRSGGPGRFTVNYNQHFNWCRNESTEQTRASEKKARDKAKNKCLPTLEELVCADFATKGVEASRQWQINYCTTEHHPTGRFSYKYNDHYNSCMKTGGLNADDEDKARNDELEACKKRRAENRFRPVTKLGVKRSTPKQESAEDEEVSEEPLQVSDAVEGLEEPYTPVRKQKAKRAMEDFADAVVEAPVRSAATEMIVVGNRGMAGARRMLGSVPNRISHHAPCSVLIVPTSGTD